MTDARPLEGRRALVTGASRGIGKATAIALATVAVGGLFLAMRTSFAPTSGSADLLFAFFQGSRISLPDTPGLLGAAYFILAAYVPLLLITHGLAFRILLQAKAVAPSPRTVLIA